MTGKNRLAQQQAKSQKRNMKGSRNTDVPEKFQKERTMRIIPLTAKNDRQKQTLNYFNTKTLVVAAGYAGTGKTELACWWASKLWLEGKINNIVITRPYKHLGGDYGATKGNDAEKLLPFCMSMLQKFKKYLGANILANNFKMDGFENLFAEADGIQIVPIEKIQGMSFGQGTVIIADEIQNASVDQAKALFTRIEEGCQVLVCGDPKQTAIGNKNGLNFLLNLVEKYPHEGVGVVHYLKEDNCRDDIVGHFVKAFDEMGDGNWLNNTGGL